MNNLKDITSEVCGIAKKTGRFLREERKIFSLDSVEQKHSHDYVSYVDKTAEKQIVEELKRLLPEAGFITEEETVEQSEGKDLVSIFHHLDFQILFLSCMFNNHLQLS